jgi:hypothetical protein
MEPVDTEDMTFNQKLKKKRFGKNWFELSEILLTSMTGKVSKH